MNQEDILYIQTFIFAIQTLVLIISAIFVWIYTKETKNLRVSNQKQLEILKDTYSTDLKIKSRSFIDLSLTVQKIDKQIKFNTKVYNNTTIHQPIKYAFLLITMQDSDILNQANLIINSFGKSIYLDSTTNFDFFKAFNIDKLILNNNLILISLPFYYCENIRIGNENPGHSYILDTNLDILNKGVYTVRFFVFPDLEQELDLEFEPEYKFHRTTADSFFVD